jgi:hypothetical protein
MHLLQDWGASLPYNVMYEDVAEVHSWEDTNLPCHVMARDPTAQYYLDDAELYSVLLVTGCAGTVAVGYDISEQANQHNLHASTFYLLKHQLMVLRDGHVAFEADRLQRDLHELASNLWANPFVYMFLATSNDNPVIVRLV